MPHPARIPFYTLAAPNLKAMLALTASVRQSSLGEHLVELVQLRLAQADGCGVSVDRHWRELIKQGADPRQLNAIAGWREAPFFSERERAALAWADAVHALPRRDDTDASCAALHACFNDEEIAELSYAIANVKAWNLINLSLRIPIPERPAPGF